MQQPTEHDFTTWDGSELFYRAWLPDEKPKHAVILFHRGHEHSGRLIDLIEDLNIPECAYFAWDARGNGQSPGPRDYADHFSDYVRDAHEFSLHLSQKYEISISDMAVIANSVGAVIASAWVHDYAPPIRALVLATPAFRIKLYVPFAIPMLRFALKLGLMKTVKSYVKSVVLTHDKQEQKAFNSDPLITRSITTNILLDVHDVSTRLIEDAGAITVPTLMHAAGSDWVVKVPPQRKFFDRLSSPVKQFIMHPGMYHAVYHEVDRMSVIHSTRAFIQKQFEMSADRQDPRTFSKRGFTRSEYDRLKGPATKPLHALNRLGMKTIGRLSAGVALGWKEGFDSGVTLDYVYENKARGITPLGKAIDWFYLNSIGWRGIRQRRIHLRELLHQTINKLRATEQSRHIVDIAAGGGRYLLEAIKEAGDDNVSALLRDYKQVNLDQAEKTANDLELTNVQFSKADAFNREELSSLSPKPTIGIVSGLYELFPENDAVCRSLEGLASAIDSGGYLIYTNQPWHPQVEFIARVLTNREGNPWVMRRRTQEEMDGLVSEAGFKKLDMLIDRWGIFTVSVAKRR